MLNSQKRVILTEDGRKFLRNLRLQKGLPLTFKNNYATIIRWENGSGNATIDLFERYINKLGLTFDYLNKNNFIKEIAPSIQELGTLAATRVPKDQHDKIIQDYKKGLTLDKISKKHNCHLVTIFYILKKYNIDMAKHGSGEKYYFPESDYIDYLKAKNITSEKILPLLASLLFTDGCLCQTLKTFEISYYGYDETLHKIFADLVWSYFKIRPSSYMIRCGKVLRTKYIDKNFIKKMLELSPTYKTKPAPKQNWTEFMDEPNKPSLKFLDKSDIQVTKEVIRLAMCADGCISVSKRDNKIFFTLILACSHPLLVKEWLNLFNLVGIKSNIVGGSSRTKIGGVKGVEDCLSKFNEFGGFIPGVKVCVRKSPLCGIEKQKILSTAVKLLKEQNSINTLQINFGEFKKLL
jgi:transcriptional regulator with XRE-family HTH domain